MTTSDNLPMAPREVIVIDAGVTDWKTLIAGLSPDIPVILLPAGGNGLEALATALQGYGALDALHLVSHGGTGRLNLGDLRLTSANLGEQGEALKAIASHLSTDSDLLVYGCSVAAGDAGQAFVQALSGALNGVDIAASTDRTGPLVLGGDWDLEYAVGAIETVLPFAVQGMNGIDHCLGCYSGNYVPGPANDGTCGGDITPPAFSSATVNASALVMTYSEALSSVGPAPSAFIVKVDGVTQATPTAVAINSANKTVTLSLATAVLNGQTVTVTYTDPTAGNDTNAIQDSTGNDAVTVTDRPVANNTPLPPSVTSINRVTSATTNATSVSYTVTFSESVIGVDVNDFSLSTSGTANGTIASVSGSGTIYTVTVNSVTGDGTLRLDLNSSGTGIQNGSSVAIASGYTSGQLYTFDHTAPAAPSVPDLASASDTGISSSDNLTSATTPTFTGTAESGATVTLYDTDGVTQLGSSVATGGTWSITSSTLGAGAHTLTAKATDAAGNTGSASSNLSVTIDTTPPTLAITSDVSTLKVGDTATVTFTFSEDPGATFTWNGSSGDVVVTGGTLGAISGSGLIRTATFTPTASTNGGTASITVAAGSYTDAAGNSGGAGTTPSITFDTLAPLLASSITVSDTALKIGDTATVTFTFTEAVTGFTTGDVAVPNGVLSNLTTGDGGTTWTATLTPNASTTAASNALTLDYSGITDLAGNAGSGTASSGNYAVDTVRPSLASSITISDTALKIGDTATVTLTFTEAVTGFTPADVTVSNGVLSNLTTGDGGTTWTATLTPSASTTAASNLLTLDYTSITDLAGNAGSGTASSGNYAVDTASPAVSSINRVGGDTVNTGDTSVGYTVTLSESVTGVDPSDFTVTATGGAAGVIASVTGSGTTYTVTVNTLSGDGTLRLDLKSSGTGITDAAGNGITSGYTGGQTYTLDHTAPAATIATLAFSFDSGISSTDFITATSSQTISGTVSANMVAGEIVQVSLDNGITWTTATTSVGQNTWSLAGQTLTASNTLQVRVADAAGNTGVTASQAYVLDTTAPTLAASTPLDNATGVSTSNNLTLTFSENVAAAEGLVLLKKSSDNSLVEQFNVISGEGSLGGQISVSGSTVTINPFADLAYLGGYYLETDLFVKDTAGNYFAGISGATALNFTTVAAPAPAPEPAPAPAPTPTVDGTPVQTSTTTNSDGSTTTTQTISPVSAGRTDTPGSAHSNLADIPLASDASGTPLVQIGLPTGVGATSSATSNTSLSLRQQLINATESRVNDTTSFGQIVLQGIDQFTSGITDASQVTVRTITLTVPTGTNTPPGQPIVITGASGLGEGSPTHPNRQEALIIDARNLPPGTVLDLSQVEFAIIIGPSTVVGGTGRNFVLGDSSAQTIVLGADDDILRGGVGNDTIGSKGGNDRLYGDEGNDTVVGGIGDDHLEGGTGDDLLIGGASDAGLWRFTLNPTTNTLTAQFSASQTLLAQDLSLSISGQWTGASPPDSRLALIGQDYSQLQTISLLVKGLTGALPSLSTLNALSTLGLSNQQLTDAALRIFENTQSPLQTPADKAKALISQVWGPGKATSEAVSIATTFIEQGGTWSQVLSILVNHENNSASITSNGQLSLTTASRIGETGWAANSGNDTLLGGAGNDVLIGGGGNDILDGGEGTDLAVFAGDIGHYSVRLLSQANNQTQGFQIIQTQTGEIDTLTGVELLQFGGRFYGLSAQRPVLPENQAMPLSAYMAELTEQQVQLMGVVTGF